MYIKFYRRITQSGLRLVHCLFKLIHLNSNCLEITKMDTDLSPFSLPLRPGFTTLHTQICKVRIIIFKLIPDLSIRKTMVYSKTKRDRIFSDKQTKYFSSHASRFLTKNTRKIYDQE